MNHLLLKLKKPKVFYLMVFALSISCLVKAQKPTSLNYPATNVFSANVTSVYLAPTVSGNVVSYSISPALPAGLSLNTNTGAISGVAAAASAATSYTITATNTFGSATKTISITVYNYYYNNNNGQIAFDHTTAAASANAATGNYYNLVGTGTTQGDQVLYKSVVTIGGIPIDCIVTTSALSLGSGGTPSYTAYDQNNATDGSTYSNNDPKYFSPQFSFGTTAGGFAKFNFQFILGGSYVSAASPGTNVVLQNVKLNTYDIDGNGGANSYQYNEFGGFSSSELGGSGTTYNTNEVVSYNTTTGLTRYISSLITNTLSITDPKNRIRVSYNNMSNFDVVIGAQGGGAAYFFLDFQAGAAFTTIQTDVPAIDLNTNLPGVNNEGDACGSALSFTGDQTSGSGKTLGSAQTNILNPPATTTAIDSLTITYINTAANLPNGANETIYIKGASAGTASYPLNFSAAGTASVTVGGLTFSVAKTVVSATQNRLSFSKSGFTLAQAETLIDSLQYKNTAGSASSIGGDRAFTVNLLTSDFKSPDAIFTASLSCVAISGHIWHDADGLTDNQVDSNYTGTHFDVTKVYAVLTNASNAVVATTLINSTTGAYTFGNQDPGKYNIYMYYGTSAPAAATTYAASTYPAGFKSTGENLGAGVGNDDLVDGKLTVTLGTLAVAEANFGIEMPPVTANSSYSNIANPGGYNYYSVPSASFSGTNTSDADGSVVSITITSFPTGANYLKIGSVIYTNPSAGICPPQSTCTAWPGTVIVPAANIGTIAVDPSSTGITTVTIPFTALDNGGLTSNASTVTINFITQAAPINITGNVWNDVNADGTKQATENLTNIAKSGENLYAVLVQNTNTYSGWPTIYTATIVSATAGYNFSDVPAGNDYEVRLISLATAPTEGGIANATTLPPALATGWTGVSTSNNGTVLSSLQNTSSLAITLANLTTTKTAQNFGIEALPTAVTATDASRLNLGGAVTSPVTGTAFSGTDLVDDPDGTISYIHITAFPSNADHITITGSTTIGGTVTTATYDAATFPASGLYVVSAANGNITTGLVAVDPATGAVTVPVPYKVVDNARVESAAVAYANVPFLATVSVSGNVWNDANGNIAKEAAENYISGTNASLSGSIATGGNLYANLINSSGMVIATTQVAADGTYSFPLVQASTSGFKIQISTNTGIVNDVQPATVMPTAWVGTGKSAGATNLNASQSGAKSIIDLTTGTVSVINQNFGLERTSSAVTQSYAMASQPAVGSSWTLNGTGATTDPGPLKGSDPEDYAAGGTLSAKTVAITSLPAKGNLKYGSTVITLGSDNINPPSVTNPYIIASYVPASLQVQFTGTGYSSLAFSYAYVDLAGVQGTTATYTINLPATLPVTLKEFTAVATGNTSLLSWTTATEKNVDWFVAERSTDNTIWTAIGTVKASGNSIEEKAYTLNDNTPAPGKNYYRLAMIDIDGKKEYSPYRIAEFDLKNAVTLSLYPNPVHSKLYIKGITEKAEIRIHNLSGNLVMLRTITANESIDVNHLAPGIYEVNINQHGILSSQKLIVIR